MARKNDESLFRLIKSLSPHEKRHFKVSVNWAERKHLKKYLILFGVLEHATTYNKDKILDKIYGNNKPASNLLPNIKAKLYAKLLKTLREYHKKESIDIQLAEKLSNIYILVKRGLKDDARKILMEMQKLSKKFNRHEFTKLSYKWEITLFPKGQRKSDIDGIVKRFREQFNKIDESQNFTTKLYLSYFFFKLVGRNYSTRIPQKISQEIERIISHYPLSNNTLPLKYEDAYLYWKMYTKYYNLHAQYDKKLSLTDNFINRFENSIFIKQNSADILEMYNEIIGKYLIDNNHTMAFNTSKKLETTISKNILSANEIFEAKGMIYLQRLFSFNITGNFLQAENQVNALLNEDPNIISSREITFQFTIGLTYFGLNKFSESLNWFNEVNKLGYLGIRKDLQVISKWITLLVYFELEEFTLLEYAILSTKRFVTKVFQLSKFEKELASLLSRLIKQRTKKEIKNTFVKFLLRIAEFKHEPKEKRMIEGYFDFPAWVKSKIEGVKFSEILQKRYSG